MKWYQLIAFDESLENPFLTDSAFVGEIEPWRFAEGKVIEDWSSQYWLRCTDPGSDGQLTDALQNHLALPVYSLRVCMRLSGLGVESIQYLPITVMRSNSTTILGYSIANILNVRQALDLSASDYTLFDSTYFLPARRGQICSIRRPVLIERAIRGVDVLRLKEYPDMIVVSDRFRSLFVEAGFSGHTFREITVVQSG